MCDCYKIGGPFIAEDPDCPRHGTEAQAEEAREREVWAERDERIAALEARIAKLEARLP